MAGTTYGELWHSTGNGSWDYLGKPAATENIDGPIAIANSGGQIHIVGVSKAPGSQYGDVWLKIYNPGLGGWLAWQYLGGADTIGGSVAVADRGGLVHVVGNTPANSLVWLKYYNGLGWQGWENLGGALGYPLAIDNANAVPRNPVMTPHVGVHITALSNFTVYLRCWDSYCGGWYWEAQSVTGVYNGPFAVTNTYGEVHMLSRGASTDLRHRERNP